jgi:predicted SAM-dependent methyltransferase
MWKKLSWYYYLTTHGEIKLIIGAGPTKYKGWFPTDIVTLDVTNENRFKKYFKKKKINKILAEHVLEHLNNDELEVLVQNFYIYSESGVEQKNYSI